MEKLIRRKISEEEVTALYRFTRQHYVEYYDVQTELVDHLANGIENQWQEDSEVTFEEALQKEFKKFGVFGFSDVVEKRVQAMEKRYFKLILKEISALLRKPSVVLPVISLFLVSFIVLELEEGLNYITYAIFAYFLILIIAFSRRSLYLKKKKKTGEKIFLLEAIIFNAGCYFSFFWFPFYIINFSLDSGSVDNIYVEILLSVLFSFLVLISFICFYHLPKKKDEILYKVHPEIKFLQ